MEPTSPLWHENPIVAGVNDTVPGNKMFCNICKKPTRPIFSIREYKVFECDACSHRQAFPEAIQSHVQRVYSDQYFMGGGDGYPNYLGDGEILTKRGVFYDRVLSRFIQNKGTFLDIGCAAGFIMKGLIDEGWSGSGIEPNRAMASYARDQLNLNVFNTTIEDAQIGSKVDLICMIQVIAHFIDPSGVIKKCKENFLKDQGYILIETWNFRSITASIFGQKWHEYSPPSVLHWFSEKSLEKLMHNSGFKKAAKGRPKKTISLHHALSLLKGKKESNKIFKALHSMLGVMPAKTILPYPADDLFWSLYQLNG